MIKAIEITIDTIDNWEYNGVFTANLGLCTTVYVDFCTDFVV